MSKQFDLVFEGGGAKGSVFVGALQEFAARGCTARRFVGTSAGAITATLMAAGYSADEMLAAVTEKLPNGKPRFSSFMDIPGEDSFAQKDIMNSLTYTFFRHVDIPAVPRWLEEKIDEALIKKLMHIEAYREMFSFIERGGLYAGDEFLKWFRSKLDAGGRNLGNTTLMEFFNRTGSDLTVVASNTAGHEMLILNHRTTPSCPLAWAVRMSMSIPFLWQEVRWQESWGKYRGKDITGNTIVDGGVLSNFPMELIATNDNDIPEIMGDTDPFAVPNLGFLIDESIEVQGAPPPIRESGREELEAGLLEHVQRLRTVRRISRLVDTMTDAHDLQSIQAYAGDVCRLPAKGYGTTEFDMSPERLHCLVEAGRNAMKAYLDKRGIL